MFRLFTLAALSVAALSFLTGNARADWTEATDGSWVFVADADDAPASTVKPAKNGCTCGPDCTCFGSGYYCGPGKCPVALDDAMLLRVAAGPECYIDPRTGRQVCPKQVVDSSAGPFAVASAPVSEAGPRRTGPLRRIFGAVFRGRLRSGGGCAACGQ